MQVPERAGMLIGGVEVDAVAGGRFDTYDPSTGELISQIAEGAQADVDRAVSVADDAFGAWWPATPPRERAGLLLATAARIRAHADELVALDERTAGLPTRMARGDVETAARYFDYYAGVADKLHGETIPLGADFVDYTEREPWGVCAIIPPFNVPLQLTARSLAPALACGNAVVIKPAEQAPLPTLRMAQLIGEAGAPDGLVNVVTGAGPQAGAALVAHPGVRHITFTGSLATGQAIMRGAAEQLIPVTLELGGKSPQIVFADADLAAVVDAVVTTSLMTAGQVCSAGTRILAQREIAGELRERLLDAVARISLGAAADGPDMGPLISATQQQRVLDAIGSAREDGAEVLSGGGAPDGELAAGYFVQPTVLGGVTGSMRVAREEVFGPVVALMEFGDEADAITIANDSEFGLVSGIWTEAIGCAHRVARAVAAARCSSTTTAPAGASSCRSAAIARAGSAVRRDWPCFMNTCRPRTSA